MQLRKAMRMLWEELNWAEFEKIVPDKRDTAILPVGTMIKYLSVLFSFTIASIVLRHFEGIIDLSKASLCKICDIISIEF